MIIPLNETLSICPCCGKAYANDGVDMGWTAVYIHEEAPATGNDVTVDLCDTCLCRQASWNSKTDRTYFHGGIVLVDKYNVYTNKALQALTKAKIPVATNFKMF